MNAFLTIFGLLLSIITAILGLSWHIGIILTLVLATTGLVGPLFAHLNRKLDHQSHELQHEN